MKKNGSILAEVIVVSFIVLTTISVVVSSLSGSIAMIERAREDFNIERTRSELIAVLCSGSAVSGNIELKGEYSLKIMDASDRPARYFIELEGISERRGTFVCWPYENKGS